ncbi:DUF6265 family protein [Amphiplicatus metriothermophilus]|uniref:DUF6265 domain-containing protein n=1 Tax=Amphiplicatus metriothermophilus TaxID=1519374 RepID=A0A239PQF7_9PROT|nr:DUF6265 family protein [Amphiplicatus metriothermophilus]MBB5518481.1 hypothetical protein [Amphiplicatus metriothermophilus]SNT72358.1 hypothetical protein SAMN06297382_1398 [Amphiplicatus metriothermophilus]
MGGLLKRMAAGLAALACWIGAAQADDLAALDFMTGQWRGTGEAAGAEEWWSPAAAGTKVAAFRWTQGERFIVAELVIISAEEDGIYLRFKHFNADYSVWEEDAPLAYHLVSADGERAEFRLIEPNPRVPAALIYQGLGEELRFRGTNAPDADSHPDDLVLTFERAR